MKSWIVLFSVLASIILFTPAVIELVLETDAVEWTTENQSEDSEIDWEQAETYTQTSTDFSPQIPPQFTFSSDIGSRSYLLSQYINDSFSPPPEV